MSNELTGFLAARLDEDEAAADEVHLPRDCGCVDRDGEFNPLGMYCSCDGPDRMRREVAAKRVILAEHEPDEGSVWCGTGEEWLGAGCATISILVSVYGGHPDYRQEWAPRPPEAE